MHVPRPYIYEASQTGELRSEWGDTAAMLL